MRSVEQSIKDKLKNLSENTGITFGELWLRLSIERFLFRLSRHEHSDHFLFKGGLLLGSYIEMNRGPRDIDFSLSRKNVNREKISKIIKEILEIKVDDGFSFELDDIDELSHPQIQYGGYRVSVLARLGKMQQKFSIDIGIGDMAKFSKQVIKVLPDQKVKVYKDEISLNAYDPEYIFSEKLETCVFFGLDNSRMKDYHDLYFLMQSCILDNKKLNEAIKGTFNQRNSKLKDPILGFTSDRKMNGYWNGHLRKVDSNKLPLNINDIIKLINEFVSKVLS